MAEDTEPHAQPAPEGATADEPSNELQAEQLEEITGGMNFGALPPEVNRGRVG